jgi:hypothetical protein
MSNSILWCSVYQELQLSSNMYILLSYSFGLKNLKSKIPRSVILQNPHMILSWTLDMLWELACLSSVPKFAQSY